MDSFLLSPIANSAMSSYGQSSRSQENGSLKTPKRVLHVDIEEQAPKTPETQKVQGFWDSMMPLTPEGVIEAYKKFSPNMNIYSGRVTPALQFEKKEPVATEGVSVPIATSKAVLKEDEPLTFEKQIEGTLKTFTDLQKCLVDAEYRLLFCMSTNLRNLSVTDKEFLAAYEIIDDINNQHPFVILAIQDKDEYVDMIQAFCSFVSLNIDEYLKVYTKDLCIGVGRLDLQTWKKKARAFYRKLRRLVFSTGSGTIKWKSSLLAKMMKDTKVFHLFSILLKAIEDKDRRLCDIHKTLKLRFSESILE